MTDRFALTDGSTGACGNLNDYCGGTWRGIINHLDYIKNMGFTAVWISPVTQQVQGLTSDGSSYHGYWQNDIYSLNTKFGTADDLKALSDALHDRGMYLMVDVVVNHFAWIGNHNSVDYSTYNPFNNAGYFHDYCPIDYNDETSEKIVSDPTNVGVYPSNISQCWMGDDTVPLPDLDTTNSEVRSQFQNWISDLVSTYGIDGLRMDTCLEVETDFFPSFLDAAGVYTICEAFNGNVNTVKPYAEAVDGVLNYPMYYPITQAFQSTSGDMANLKNNVNTVKSSLADTSVQGSFLENHDNVRFPSLTGDIALAKNAVAFTILADGIPVIYYGQEQHFSGGSTPNNREALWPTGYSTSTEMHGLIALANVMRNHAIAIDDGYLLYQAWPIYQDTTTIAMRKGTGNQALIGVFSNKGSSGDAYTQSIPQTGYDSGAKIVDAITCDVMTAASDGSVTVSMGAGAVKILYPEDNMSGSGLCGY